MDLRDASIFAAVCKAEGLPEPVFEHMFAKVIGRRWRFDVAFLYHKVGVEWEGITWYGNRQSRHTNAKGYTKDLQKYNAAAKLGWTVLRYSQLNQDEVIEDLREIFNLR